MASVDGVCTSIDTDVMFVGGVIPAVVCGALGQVVVGLICGTSVSLGVLA